MIRDVTPEQHPSPSGSQPAAAGERSVTVHSDRVRRSQPVEMTPSMAYAMVRNPRRLENREPLRIRAAVTALSELNDPNPTVIRRVRLGEAPPADPARPTEPPSRTGPRPTKPGEVRPHADRATYRTLPRPGGRDAAVVAQVFGLLDSDSPVGRPGPATPAAAAPGASAPVEGDAPTPDGAGPAAATAAPGAGRSGGANGAGPSGPTGTPSSPGADGAGSPGTGAPATRHRPAPAPNPPADASSVRPAPVGPPQGTPAARAVTADPTSSSRAADAARTGPADGAPTAGDPEIGARRGGLRPDDGPRPAATSATATGEAATAPSTTTPSDDAAAPAAPKLRWWQRLFGRRASKGCQMCGWRGEGPCPLGHR